MKKIKEKEILTDEKLASEDWKCLFLITLTMLFVTLGFLINGELNTTEEYCNKDFCVKEIRSK